MRRRIRLLTCVLRRCSGQDSDLMPNIIRYPKNSTQYCVCFDEVFVCNDTHHNKEKNPHPHVRGSWGNHATHQEKNPLPYGASFDDAHDFAGSWGNHAAPRQDKNLRLVGKSMRVTNHNPRYLSRPCLSAAILRSAMERLSIQKPQSG